MTKIIELYILGAIAFAIAISDGSTLTKDEMIAKTTAVAIWPAVVVGSISITLEGEK